MGAPDLYSQKCARFVHVVEEQREMGRTAASLEKDGLPLIAEWYAIQSKKLTDEMFELDHWNKAHKPGAH